MYVGLFGSGHVFSSLLSNVPAEKFPQKWTSSLEKTSGKDEQSVEFQLRIKVKLKRMEVLFHFPAMSQESFFFHKKSAMVDCVAIQLARI